MESDFLVNESLHEEIGQCRRNDLYLLFHQPVCQPFLGERIEFEKYLSDNTDLWTADARTAGLYKLVCRLSEQCFE